MPLQCKKRLTPKEQNEIVYVMQNKFGVHEALLNGVNLNPTVSRQDGTGVIQPTHVESFQPVVSGSRQDLALIEQTNQDLNIVSDFVIAIRLNQHPEDNGMERRRSDVLAANLDQAQARADKAIIEAEKFRATTEPPGRSNYDKQNLALVEAGQTTAYVNDKLDKLSGNQLDNRGLSVMLDIGSGISDDDFFHLTCHIEPSLIYKIKKGEPVELKKLLPKDKINSNGREENRLEWVQRDGGTLLVPAQKDNKISGFHQWEQVFRAYTTIYCGANPHRAKENLEVYYCY